MEMLFVELFSNLGSYVKFIVMSRFQETAKVLKT